MIVGVDMYLKKKEENVSCLLVVVVLFGIKRTTIVVTIAASKRPIASKDKHIQRGEYRQQDFLPHNLTNTYL
jgi:hypothetical protein